MLLIASHGPDPWALLLVYGLIILLGVVAVVAVIWLVGQAAIKVVNLWMSLRRYRHQRKHP